MGEVYRARDGRLDREVAIKVLPTVYAADPARMARFRREAKALAALNHPNIASIHGFDEASGTCALVMELVEGEDLAARVGAGPIPVLEALPIARQIAEALEAAHQHGIIHRDLKPGNIRIRLDGTVKLLDFGLAKALNPADGGPAVSQAATATSAQMTHAGLVLGTVAYLSPEQARGKAVDKGTDIWAFGCVVYEMLTGRQAFAGDHQSDVLASILTSEPAFGALPDETPPSIRRLLRRCLQKDPSERLRDMGDARLEIRDAEAGTEPRDMGPATATGGGTRERLAWVAVAVLTAALLALMLWPRASAIETRVNIVTPPTPSPGSVAISPDGRTLVFAGSSGAESRLWLRSLQADASHELAGTEGADAPFWSPDGRSVGFFAGGRLKRVDLDGGSVQTLANASTGTDGTWGRQGDILFAARGNPILRVSAREGGEPVAVSGLMQGSNFSPHFLPDGRRFLYYLRGSPEVRGVYVGDLRGNADQRRLLDSDAGAVYSPSGHLLFILKGTLLAQRFDLDQLTVSGAPFPIAEQVAAGVFGASVSVSNTGSIAYRAMAEGGSRQLVWFDRTGKELGRLGDPGETFSLPSLSPDGEHVVFYRVLEGNVDIWRMDTSRGALVRITTDPADDVSPVWSPDGSRIAFASTRSGTPGIYLRPITGGREELLLSTPAFKLVTDWSRDGRFLLFTTADARRSLDVWALPLEGDRKPFPVTETPAFNEQSAQFSPDGRWIAYQSDESGRPEIYLQSFPGADYKLSISTAGGSQVRWSGGSELLYVAHNGDLMAVSLQFPSGRSPVVGRPVRLFAPPIGSARQLGDARHQYMLSSDGRRVLVAAVMSAPVAPVSLILNWKARP